LMAITGAAAFLVACAERVFTPFPAVPVFKAVRPSNIMIHETIRIGDMPPETAGQFVWPIANDGRAPLLVFPVCSSFGCRIRGIVDGRETMINDGRLTIPPGGAADILIEWRTGKLPGPYSTYAVLGTSDPRSPEIRISVEGSVKSTR
jgi:hypothetical protein